MELVNRRNFLLLILYLISFLAFLSLSAWSDGFHGFSNMGFVIQTKIIIKFISFSVAIVFLFKYSRLINQYIRTPYLEIFLFYIVASFSLLYTPDFTYSMFRLTEHIGYFIFPLVIVINISQRAKTPEDILKFGINLILYGLGLLVLITWLVAFIAPEYAFRHLIGNITGLGGSIIHVHTLAIISSIIYGVNMCRLFGFESGNKIINLTVSIIMLLTIYLTHSRTGILIVLVITMMIVYQSHKNYIKILFYALLSSIGMIFLIMNLDAVVELILRGQNLEELLSLTERTTFWKVLIVDTLSESPILGYGYQMMSYDGLSKNFTDLGYSRSNAHNTFIQTFVGLGLVGLMLLLYHLLKVIQCFNYVNKRISENVKERVFELKIIVVICILASLTQYGIVGITTPVVPIYLMAIMLITYLRVILVGSFHSKRELNS
jgi:DNA-binding transcriptional regulator of glucitol operon